MGADVAVRVVLGRQEQKFDAARICGVGQCALQGLTCGAATSGVAVKTEDHRIGELEELLHMVGRAGGAQCSHGIRKAQLRQSHHVHIAFRHQHVAGAVQGFACFKQAVQLTAFVEDGGFG